MRLAKPRVFILTIVIGGLAGAGRAEAGSADDIVAYTNGVRAQYGLAPLSVSAELSDAAFYHARNMAAQSCMSHDLDGYDPEDRMRAFGYENNAWAENVAYGYDHDDPAWEAIAMWVESPTHLANMLNPDVTEIGVGVAVSQDGTIFYCQDFGSR